LVQLVPPGGGPKPGAPLGQACGPRYLLALVADVVGVSVHGEAGGVAVEPGARRGDGLALVQALVLQPHQGLPPHVLVKLPDGVQQVLDHQVVDFVLDKNKQTI